MLDDRHYMRTDYRPQKSMTVILLITNIVCFFVLALLEKSGLPVTKWLALSIDGLKHGLVYQLITFQFMHAGLLHLLGNMIGLFFFGRAMEAMLGRNGLLKLYLFCGTVGGLVQLAFGFLSPYYFGGSVVGASAGVFGLIAAFAVTRPNQPITLLLFFIIPVTFPAKVILIVQAVIAVWGIAFPGEGVAHAAHLGGMLAGIAFVRWISGAHSFNFHLPRFFRRNPRVIITPPKRLWRRSRSSSQTDDLPADQFMSSTVDPILEKISAHGIHSLTDEERQILENARRKMARR